MKKISWADILVLFLLMTIGAVAYFYIDVSQENEFLLKKVNDQAKSLSDIKNRDSVYTQNNKKYSQIITKYVDGTTFTINGKKYTSDDILNLYLDADNKKQQALIDLEYCKEVLKFRSDAANEFGKIATKANKYATDIGEQNNKNIKDYNSLLKKYPPEKFKELEFFYKTAKKIYGLDYQITLENDSVRTLNFNSTQRLDSALWIYDDFKKGRLRINLDMKYERKKR
jgi:hypothetical protein